MNAWQAIAVAIVSVLAACSDDDSATSETPWCAAPGSEIRASPDACSSTKSVSPPLRTQTGTDSCVQCTPRCGATKYLVNAEEYYTDTDLPAGSCTHDGEQCDMAATAPLSSCHGVVRGCAINAYRCSCTSGTWQCVMTGQGAGACEVCQDGGMD